MKLSVITINYNNCEGLERTIKSVLAQSCKDFEYVVVDGGSTDGGADLLNKYSKCIDKGVSEPDGGLYAAINKGARMASGEYCLFLNSGDTFFSETTVQELYSCCLEADFIEGRIMTVKGLHIPYEKYTLNTYIYKSNNFHQASLIKRIMILERPYDENLKIAADLKFNINNIVIHGCSFSTVPVIISNYEPGGRSATVRHHEEIDSIFKELIPERIWDDYKANAIYREFPTKYFSHLIKAIANSKFSVWLYSLLSKKESLAERWHKERVLLKNKK